MGMSKLIRRSAGVLILGAILAAGPARAERLCDDYGGVPSGSGVVAGMVHIEGGTFTMGDDDERTEERRAPG